MFGAIDVLLPLRVDDLGGGHALIAVGFIGGAAIESVLAPLAGRMSDGSGGALPTSSDGDLRGVDGRLRLRRLASDGDLRPAPHSLGSGFCFAPAMTLISDAAERERPAPGLRGRRHQTWRGRRRRCSAAWRARRSPG